MKQDIRLYIGEQEVEFKADPKILFNYKISDSTKPTAIKNSFSKSITIDGTPRNNDIFGNIWNLERAQFYGNDVGVGFNPQVKTPFTLYVNGSIYESGYCKLESINKKKDGGIQYQINLFGGLGELFYALTYVDADGENDTKKTLADLQYDLLGDDGSLTETIDLDFTINKESVFDAWSQIGMSPDAVYDEAEADRPNNYVFNWKWDYVNFMPAYEGIPEDFDSSKVLMNKKGNEDNYTWAKDGYTDANGFALGELKDQEMTVQETRDYRSYLQRPVFRMKRIIEACQNPINNGGWELKLDESFFNRNNPYYEDTWLTLNMLRSNIEGGETETETEVTLVRRDPKYFDLTTDSEILGDYTNINYTLGIGFNNITSTTADALYLNYQYDGSNGVALSEVCRRYIFHSAIILQMVGYDAIGSVVGYSDIHYLYSGTAAGINPNWDKFKTKWNDNTPNGSIIYHSGYFMKDSAGYVWTDGGGKATGINFRFNSDNKFSRVALKIVNPYVEQIKEDSFLHWGGFNYGAVYTTQPYLFATPYVDSSSKDTVNQAMAKGNPVNGNFTYDTVNASLTIKDYEGLFSGTKIRKKDYLSTEKTPCDYLTSYAKMFGLYFWSDPGERPSDEVKYPKGVIHLLTRDSFYDRVNIVDLEKRIDRNKDIKITPSVATTKWVEFGIEQVESEAAADYQKTYGQIYGNKRANTGFNFNSDTEQLLPEFAFRSGIEVLETNKFFSFTPGYLYNGFSYNLYMVGADGEYETTEIEIPVSSIPNIALGKNGWLRTDSFPKLQFHSADNESVDGEDVLVFFEGTSYPYEQIYDTGKYYITDDLAEMQALNDGNPCWIYSADDFTVDNYNSLGVIGPKRIRYTLQTLPVFRRTLPGANGYLIHTLDMGKTNMTFVRNTFVSDDSSIYDKCWKRYINDMYDIDSRILSCYVRLDGMNRSDIMRKFYWFDNSLWRVNSIKDWDFSGYETVKMDFVKVQDVENFTINSFTRNPNISFTFPALKLESSQGNNNYYRISSEAQDIVGLIYTQNAGYWVFENDRFMLNYEDGTKEWYDYVDYMTPTTLSGQGDTFKTFSIPANTSIMERTWKFQILSGDDEYFNCYIIQDPAIVKTLSLNTYNVSARVDGGSYPISGVYNNRENDTLSYTLSDDGSSWVTVNINYNEDNVGIMVGVSPNSGLARQTELELYNNTSGVYATVTIKQSGSITPTLSLEPTTINALAEGKASQNISVISNTDNWYYDQPTVNWITINGGDADSINITINSNPTSFNRTGAITFMVDDGETYISKTLTVNQVGLVGKVRFGNSSLTIPTITLDAEEGARGSISITRQNIASTTFIGSPSNKWTVYDNGNTIAIVANTANTGTTIIRGTIQVVCKDTNGNTITTNLYVNQNPSS